MEYIIREIQKSEYHLLEDFCYEAIFIPEGVSPPPKSVIYSKELQVYIENFGKKKDDKCFVAVLGGKIIGAVWVRMMYDYGHVDDETPSFAISLYKEYRGHGIGTALMKKMLAYLREAGYAQCSLSCQKANYAVNMYRKLGFEIIREHGEEYIMICRFH